MATSSTYEKLCEPCQEKKKKVKVRSFCFECQELLCKECSDIHLTFKISKNHNLIDLIPLTKKSTKQDQSTTHTKLCDDSAENSSDFIDDELSSDFLEHVTLTKDTILYGAQVAVDHKGKSSADSSVDPVDQQRSTASGIQDSSVEPVDPKSYNVNATTDSSVKPVDSKRFNATKVVDFDSLTEDERGKMRVTGVISLSDGVIVVATDDKLKFFDQNGKHLSSSVLNSVYPVFSITIVQDSTFAVCGSGSIVQVCSFDGELREGSTYKVDHLCNGICFNGTFYGVLHRTDRIVTILDGEGTTVRKMTTSDVNGKEVKLGSDIHMDKATNNLYIPCQLQGVLCMSIKGDVLWMKSFPATYTIWGIVELYDILCIAHFTNTCLELMSKDGNYIGSFLENNDMNPTKIFFCERLSKLYVTYGRRNADKNPHHIVWCHISVFAIDNKEN